MPTYPTSNLLTNGGAEAGDASSWTNVTGTLSAQTSFGGRSPRTGSYFFVASLNAPSAHCYQDVTIGSEYLADVDAAKLRARFLGWQWGAVQADHGYLELEFRDSGGGTLGYVPEIPSWSGVSWASWVQRQIFAPIPANTRTIRCHLYGTRTGGSNDVHVYWDDLDLDIRFGVGEIIFADGFGHWADGSHTVAGSKDALTAGWEQFSDDVTVTDIGSGRKWIANSDDGTPGMSLRSERWWPASEFRVCVSLRLSYGSPAASDETPIWTLQDWQNQDIFTGRIHTDRRMRLAHFFESGGWTSTNTQLTEGQEYDLAWEVYVHNSEGFVRFYINGALDAEWTSQDTLNAFGGAMEKFLLGRNATTVGDIFYKEHKVTDVLVTTAYLGRAAQVITKTATLAGGENDFTANGAPTVQECVDEIGADDDTTYASSNTNGHRMGLKHAAAGKKAYAARAIARVRSDGSGEQAVMLGLKKGTGEVQGASVTHGTSYDHSSPTPLNPSSPLVYTDPADSETELTTTVLDALNTTVEVG